MLLSTSFQLAASLAYTVLLVLLNISTQKYFITLYNRLMALCMTNNKESIFIKIYSIKRTGYLLHCQVQLGPIQQVVHIYEDIELCSVGRVVQFHVSIIHLRIGNNTNSPYTYIYFISINNFRAITTSPGLAEEIIKNVQYNKI